MCLPDVNRGTVGRIGRGRVKIGKERKAIRHPSVESFSFISLCMEHGGTVLGQE